MTFNAIVSLVLSLTNQTSTTATTRIGTYVNLRYRAILSSVGLEGTVNTSVTATASIGSRFLTFTCEKLFSVYDATQTPPAGILGEWTLDEMRNQLVGTDPPQHYAIYLSGASSVQIMIDTIAASTFTLTADAEVNITDLSGTNVPAMPQDYHDAIFMGAMADELTHLEKYDKAQYWERKYDGGDAMQHKGGRLGDLRYFLATSNYKTIFQGKMAENGVIVQPTVS